jgi:hypothetical protein
MSKNAGSIEAGRSFFPEIPPAITAVCLDGPAAENDGRTRFPRKNNV